MIRLRGDHIYIGRGGGGSCIIVAGVLGDGGMLLDVGAGRLMASACPLQGAGRLMALACPRVNESAHQSHQIVIRSQTRFIRRFTVGLLNFTHYTFNYFNKSHF
jgi:hypothetical protein